MVVFSGKTGETPLILRQTDSPYFRAKQLPWGLPTARMNSWQAAKALSKHRFSRSWTQVVHMYSSAGKAMSSRIRTRELQKHVKP